MKQEIITCAARHQLTSTDFRRVLNLYGSAERSHPGLVCELEEGHAEHHVHRVISQDLDGTVIQWWASWHPEYGGGGYALFTAPLCDFTDDGYDCYLILGHTKGHALD